jgi:hypothetical protein
VPFSALEVSAGVADEDEALPGDRGTRLNSTADVIDLGLALVFDVT